MLISTCSRLLARTARPACSACQVQRRFAHKLVEVELTADVPSLGLRGARVPVSRGMARNQLIPLGYALLIGTDGKPVSAVNAMTRKSLEVQKGLRGEREADRQSRANKALNRLEQSVEDPLRIAEQSLLDSLSTIPQPLEFSRLTTSSTSSDLFGSVSVQDVITALRERDIKIEDGMGSFGESEGIEKGRVKKTGTFDFVINFRSLDQSYPLQIRVDKE
ncbi:bL9 family ribosomal protein [Sporobolomyces salmoneus]|uniref:bL9 family ribosomal protein n=1 Tax=Sporobolomyces salmoneus TaxID=183962 RepID=UPI0031777978